MSWHRRRRQHPRSRSRPGRRQRLRYQRLRGRLPPPPLARPGRDRPSTSKGSRSGTWGARSPPPRRRVGRAPGGYRRRSRGPLPRARIRPGPGRSGTGSPIRRHPRRHASASAERHRGPRFPNSIPLTSSPPPWLAPTPEPSPPSWQTPTPRSAQPAPPPPPPPPPPGSGAPPPPSPPAVPAWRPPSRVDPPGSSAREDDPWSWAPRDDAPPPPARVPPPPASPPGAPDHPPRSAAADPTWPLGGPDAPPEPDGSDQDAAPDPLINSVIARAARPPQPVPTTLISRLRDQVALRLALRRGAGAAAERHRRGHRRRRPGSRRPSGHARFDRAAGGRDAIAHGPAQRGVSAPPSRCRGRPHLGASGPGPGRTIAMARDAVPHRHHRRGAAPDGRLLRGARPGSRPARAGSPHPPAGESRHRAGSAGGSVAQMAARFGELPHQVRRLAAHPRRRWLLVAGLAALVLIVSLVVIHPGAPSPVARPLTTPAPVASLQPSLAPATQPATNLAPSASSAPTLSPAATATPVPTPAVPASSQSFGSRGLRMGDRGRPLRHQPDGDSVDRHRLLGGTGAEPRATAGFSSPTTLVVTLTRANAPSLAPGTEGS